MIDRFAPAIRLPGPCTSRDHLLSPFLASQGSKELSERNLLRCACTSHPVQFPTRLTARPRVQWFSTRSKGGRSCVTGWFSSTKRGQFVPMAKASPRTCLAVEVPAAGLIRAPAHHQLWCVIGNARSCRFVDSFGHRNQNRVPMVASARTDPSSGTTARPGLGQPFHPPLARADSPGSSHRGGRRSRGFGPCVQVASLASRFGGARSRGGASPVSVWP